MKGKVNSRNEAIVKLRVHGRGGLNRTVSTVVDTGFSNFLTLPPRVIRKLNLRRIGSSEAELADGKIVTFDVYEGFAEWEGRRHRIQIDEANAAPLLGMEMLKGQTLTVEVWPQGGVTVSKRPRNSRVQG